MSLTLTQVQFAELYRTAKMNLPIGVLGVLVYTIKETDTLYTALFTTADSREMYPAVIEVV
jgi:hypothetical protein